MPSFLCLVSISTILILYLPFFLSHLSTPKTFLCLIFSIFTIMPWNFFSVLPRPSFSKQTFFPITVIFEKTNWASWFKKKMSARGISNESFFSLFNEKRKNFRLHRNAAGKNRFNCFATFFQSSSSLSFFSPKKFPGSGIKKFDRLRPVKNLFNWPKSERCDIPFRSLGHQKVLLMWLLL